MNWQEICELEILKDAPFKVETDKWGNIMMTPASNRHGRLQGKIAALLESIGGIKGGVLTECSIQTTEGVKVPDVAWASLEFFGKYHEETPYPEAPEICVEIVSPRNSKAEMLEKKELYFACGAREVWICQDSGEMEFYDQRMQLQNSEMFPEFPNQIRFGVV